MAEHLPPEPIVGLTLRFLDGLLSESEAQALAENLRADQVLADRFVEVCYQEQLIADIGAASLEDEDPDADVSTAVMLDIIRRERDARLTDAATAAKSAPPPASPARYFRPPADDVAPPRVIVIPRWAIYGSIAAVLVVLASVYLAVRPGAGPPAPAIVEATPPPADVVPAPVARLVRARGAVWAGPDGLPDTAAPGPLLRGERLVLLEGLAEVEMENGARVLLQGPASVEVTSGRGMRLDRGRLTANAGGGAEGFEVWTHRARIVDLGTAFGVAVEADGRVRAEVFDGHVALTPVHEGLEAQEVGLREGQGLAFNAAGTSRSIPANELGYVREAEFDALLKGDAGSAYHRWLAYTYQVRRDPAVVAFYVFDQADVGRNRLINHAVGRDIAADGFLGNGGDLSPPTWTDGRFEQTRALGFGIDRHGDCRGVLVPDSAALDFQTEMTIAAWVRLDRSSGVWNTILSKRDIPPAALNYQFSISGQWYDGHCRFQFGAGFEAQQVAGFDETQPAEGVEDPAGWQHVAVVSDGATLRYYINGERVAENDQPMPAEVNNAPLLIGTSPPQLRPPYQNGLRPLVGAMSELLLARRAMTDTEVRSLYEAGRPQE